MKLAILTCVHGRPHLTKAVLDWTARVAAQCPFEVALFAVGSEGDTSRALVESYGWNYLDHANQPLSEKFQAGLSYIGETTGVDAVMVLGSDDLVTRELLVAAVEAMTRSVDLWGLSDAFFLAPGPRSISG